MVKAMTVERAQYVLTNLDRFLFAPSERDAAVEMLAGEVERLRALEHRVLAATVAGVDAIVRDAALQMLNYDGWRSA